MTRTIEMSEYGEFTVSDDPYDIIAGGLVVAAAPSNRGRAEEALAPDGDGLHIQGIGSIGRITSREELPAEFDGNPATDPEQAEMWLIVREGTRQHRYAASMAIRGDELRALVAQALELRRRLA